MPSIKDFDRIELSPEFQSYSLQDQADIKSEWIKKNIASTPEFKAYSEDDQIKILNTLANRKPIKTAEPNQLRLAAYQPTPTSMASESDFVPGVQRGLQNLQASWYGAGALAGKGLQALGAEDTGKKLWDIGIEGYKRNIKEAGQYPKKVSFKDIYTGKSGVGGAIDWLQGTAGELVPSMAEAAIGAAVGTLTAGPVAGTAAGGLAGRALLKKGIDQAVKKAVKEGIKGETEAQIRKQVTKQALKKLGGKAGIGAAVMPMETGGMYGELLESHGIDAPETALLFGALATSLEFFGGNSKLVDVFVDSLAKGSPGLIKRSAKELLSNIPEEALQEGGQELLNILNTVVNTDEKLLTAENVEQIIESAAAGAIGGGMGAVTATVMGGKESKQERIDRLLEKQAQNIISGGPENIKASTTKLDEDINKINTLLNDPDALAALADNMDTTPEKLTISLSNQVLEAKKLQNRLNKELGIETVVERKTQEDPNWALQEQAKIQMDRQKRFEEIQKSPEQKRRLAIQEEINNLWDLYNQEEVPPEPVDKAALSRQENQRKLDKLYMPAEQELDEIHNKKIRALQEMAETPEEKSFIDGVIANFQERMRNRKQGIAEENIPILEAIDIEDERLVDPSVEEPYDMFARTIELLGGKVEPDIIYDKDAYRREIEEAGITTERVTTPWTSNNRWVVVENADKDTWSIPKDFATKTDAEKYLQAVNAKKQAAGRYEVEEPLTKHLVVRKNQLIELGYDIADKGNVEVQIAKQDINTEPTEAQKEAGNYKKGHIKFDGFDITIENPAGSTRSGKDQDGNEWSTTMAGHYGYFKRSEGKDGDQVDVFIKPGTTESPSVYVIDQVDPKTGKFDEHKVIMGTTSEQEAKDLYMANYDEGWNGFGAIKEMNQSDFKDWLEDGKRKKKPVALSKKTEASTFTDEPQVLGKQIASDLSEKDPTNSLKFDNVADPGEGFPVRYQFSITDGPARTATFSVDELTEEAVQAGRDKMIALRQQAETKPEFEIREDQVPGLGLELDDIRKLYPGQDVFLDDGGKISVRLKNGQGITFENVRDAGKDFIEFAIQTGQMSKNGRILGITVDNKILLDSEFADNMTLWHENKHVLDNLGIITEADNSVLNREFNKLRKANKLKFQLSTHEDPKQAMAENRANTFAQVMTSREEYRNNSVLNKMIQRAMDFFNQLYVLGKRVVGNTGFQNTGVWHVKLKVERFIIVLKLKIKKQLMGCRYSKRVNLYRSKKSPMKNILRCMNKRKTSLKRLCNP